MRVVLKILKSIIFRYSFFGDMYVVLMLCVLWGVYMAFFRKRNMKYKMPPKYPGALPLIGHTHLLLYHRKDLYAFVRSVTDFCMKSGGVTCGNFAGQIYYGVVDPEDAATVANTALQKHYLYKIARPWIGNGLVTSSGAEYKHHRKLLSPAFSLSVVYGFLDVFNSQARRLIEQLESHDRRGPFDPFVIFKNITLRTSCITVFGENDEKDSSFINTYVDTVESLFHIMMDRISMPWLHNDFLYSLSGLKRKQDELLTILHGFTDEVIVRKKADMKNKANLGFHAATESNHKPFVDIILEIATEEGGLSDLDVRDELNTTVLTSYETTAQQLAFIVVLLGSYPDVQRKILNEVMEVVGDRDVEKQDISKLVYTEAVIKECMRIIAPICFINRYVDKDIELKKYTLQAGSNVFIIPDGIHRHPDWGPDVDSFNPDRWLNKEMLPKFTSMSYAFSFGTRSCIGRKYAMVSLKVALVHLIRQFNIKADHTKMKLTIDVVTRPVSGNEIEIKRRDTKFDKNQNIPLSVFSERIEFHGTKKM